MGLYLNHEALANFLFIAIGTAIAWWLSGHDHRVTGENPKADFVRRATRTGVTFVLLAAATLNGFAAVFIFAALGFYWANCGAELFTHQFHKLIDPEDKRPYDPKETDRKLDRLAQLTREGRMNEALDLCSQLQQAGEGSALALEAVVHRLYLENLNSAETSPLLAEIRSLCERKQFDPAESRLKQILAAQPSNWPAMLLLMRVYAKDLSQPDKAIALLQPVGNQLRLHPAFAEYARKSIDEWSSKGKGRAADASRVAVESHPPPAAVEVSIDDLLKNNQLSTAVESLEISITEAPKNFDLWLKLAEVYGVNCADLNRAGKIIQKMESSSNFTPQEIQLAKTKLREWREGRRL